MDKKIIIKIIASLILFINIEGLFAQSPYVNKTFDVDSRLNFFGGGSLYDGSKLYCNGLIVDSIGKLNYSLAIIEEDSMILFKEYSLKNKNAYRSIASMDTIDGYIYDVGTLVDNVGKVSGFLVKADFNLDTVWTKEYSCNCNINFFCQLVSDDTIYVSGVKRNDNQVAYDYYLAAIDKHGNIIWERTYGGTNEEWLNKMTMLDNGDFLLSGYSYSYHPPGSINQNFNQGYVVRVRHDGSFVWEKFYGLANDNDIVLAEELSDGNLIMYGNFVDRVLPGAPVGVVDTSCTRLMKTTPDGTIIWEKILFKMPKVNSNGVLPIDMFEEPNGDMIFWGNAGYLGMLYYPVQMFKTNLQGDTLWSRTYANRFTTDNYPNTCIRTADGGFLFTGFVFPEQNSTQDGWIFRLDQEGCEIEGCHGFTDIDEEDMVNDISIYPNPTSSHLFISHKSTLCDIQIYDMLGNKILDRKIINDADEFMLDVANLMAGIYILQTTNHTGQQKCFKWIKY